MYFCLFMYNIVPTFLIAELETLVSMSTKPFDSKKSVPRSTVPTLIHSKVTIKLYRIQPLEELMKKFMSKNNPFMRSKKRPDNKLKGGAQKDQQKPQQ